MPFESFPSIKLTTIDVPDVLNFDAKFKYNFFVPDESINESRHIPTKYKSFTKASSKDFQALLENTSPDILNNFVPRYVKLSFNAAPIINNVKKNEFISDAVFEQEKNIKISTNIGNLIDETSFSNAYFGGVILQDDGFDGKMNLLVSGSVNKLINTKNQNLIKQINEQTKNILSAKIKQLSQTDKVKLLNANTSNDVLPKLLLDAMRSTHELSAQFINHENRIEVKEKVLQKFKDYRFETIINNKFPASILRTTLNDPLAVYTDELLESIEGVSYFDNAVSIQTSVQNAVQPGKISEAEYQSFPLTIQSDGDGSQNSDLKFIVATPIDGINFGTQKLFKGYVIKKYKRSSDGHQTLIATIPIDNPTQKTYYDLEIAYNQTYIYNISTVYTISLPVVDKITNQMLAATFLIVSRPLKSKLIDAVETVPPRPPIDLKIFFDYSFQAPVLSWSFPTNIQRDIKRFQVFRRKSTNEPFELLTEIDFDDSVIRYENTETINADLVEKTPGVPKLYFIDEDFNKNSSYIYALCTIDAHGLTSNYSIQMKVSFNINKNILVKELLSVSGAPKQYPNFYLENVFSKKSIEDSGHYSVHIYFSPEYAKIKDSLGEKEDIFVVSEDGFDDVDNKQDLKNRYKLQFINLDNQKTDSLDIIITDTDNMLSNLSEEPDIFADIVY